MIYESPALIPKLAPSSQQEQVPSFNGYRKASLNYEGMDFPAGRKNTDEFSLLYKDDLKKLHNVKRERIREIGEEGSNEENGSMDNEGFKKPKEMKPSESIAHQSPLLRAQVEQKKNIIIMKEGQPSPYLIFMQNNNPCGGPFKTQEEGNDIRHSPSSQQSPFSLIPPSPMLCQPNQYIECGIHPALARDFKLDGPEPVPIVYQQQQQVTATTGEYVSMTNAMNNFVEQKENEGFKETDNRLIGTLTVSQRREKIRKYFEKRKRRIWRKKISYDCRKKMADKRLRIKGRFVTRDQACALLGTTAEDLSSNEMLKNLVNSNSNCSIVTSAHNMKIRNIQTLFLPPSGRKRDLEQKRVEEVKARKKDIKVEILKSCPTDQTVEIKIEPVTNKKGISKSNTYLICL
jgi:phosphopantetheine adenylyltransferase